MNLYSTLTLLLVATLMASGVSAQDYERYKPQVFVNPQNTNSNNLKLDELEPVAGNDKELLESLNAVLILDDSDKVQKDEPFKNLKGIHYDFEAKNSLVYGDGVRCIIENYLNKSVSLKSLNQLSRDIILYYRKQGQPVVDVILSPQKITAGTVQIVVIESRVGKVSIEGCEYSCTENLLPLVCCTVPRNRVYQHAIENDLLWLNQYPFRRVSVDLEPGEPGQTDVMFDVEEIRPFKGYFGYEDTGVRSLNLERLNLGFAVGNLFNKDGIFSYQYTTDAQFDRLDAHALSYSRVFNRRWSVNTFASWAAVEPDFGIVTQGGESWQTGLVFNRTLIKNKYRNLDWSIGADFKQTNNNVEFGGQNVLTSAADLFQLRSGITYLNRFRNNDYFLTQSDTFIGPGGGFSSDHNGTAFSTIRDLTGPDYIYSRLRMERLWNTRNCLQLVTRFSGQIASDRLLFSETLGFGGFDSVRGYDRRVFSADQGWLAGIELGPRPFQRQWGRDSATIKVFGFIDTGQGYIINPQIGESDGEFLMSFGLGTRMAVNDRWTFRAEYGHGTEKIPNIIGRDRFHFGFVSFFGPKFSKTGS